MTTLELAERCEAATADNQHIVIMAAMDAVARAGDGAVWDKAIKFHVAGAYVDAALTLVPDGWRWSRYSRPRSDEPCWVSLVSPAPWKKMGEGEASTPALAICAAALRARAA